MFKKLAVLAVAAVIAAPAMAWGDREQGALAGFIGALILQNHQQQNQSRPPVIVQPRVEHERYRYEEHRYEPGRVYQHQSKGLYPDYSVCQDIWNYQARESCYRGAEARARREQARLNQEAYRRGLGHDR